MQTVRTTLNLPLPLIKEAQKRLGVKTKTEAIVLSLKEIIRQNRLLDATRTLAGKVDLKLTKRQLKRLRRQRFK